MKRDLKISLPDPGSERCNLFIRGTGKTNKNQLHQSRGPSFSNYWARSRSFPSALANAYATVNQDFME